MLFFLLVRFQCNFESDMCTFEQDTTDNTVRPEPGSESFDWERLCGETFTRDTGPDSGAENTACFAYIETSDPQRPFDEARLFPKLSQVSLHF